MPRHKIGGEEKGGGGDGDCQGPARPVNRLVRRPGEQEQEGQRQRQPPEARSDRPDSGMADEEGPRGERNIADQQRGESPAMRSWQVSNRHYL